MTGTCDDCGRPFPIPIGEPVGNAVSPCLRLFYTRICEEELSNDALIECQALAIKRLKARVAQLEGELENFDTVDAQNHAVHEAVDKLNRILDEREQHGRFGSDKLQRFAQRILNLEIVAWETSRQ